MDPLSDVLSLLKPQSYLTAGLDVGGRWAIRFTGRMGTIKCYTVTEGACWLQVDGVTAPVRLAAGDGFMMPNGRSFTLASDLTLTPAPAGEVLGGARHGAVVVHGGGGDAMLAGNRFEVDARKAQALLATLAPIIHFRATEDQAILRWSIERMMVEVRERRPGMPLVAHHLAHLLLLQALRQHLAQATDGQVGWFYALADPQVGEAMAAMHADPAHRWTLGELARRAGMSRSPFAQRFRERVGEPPIAYLTRWRMMLAAERLAESRYPLAEAARSLGYGSENAFNTAFKRVMGCSPRRYVRQDADCSALSRQGPAPISSRERTGVAARSGASVTVREGRDRSPP